MQLKAVGFALNSERSWHSLTLPDSVYEGSALMVLTRGSTVTDTQYLSATTKKGRLSSPFGVHSNTGQWAGLSGQQRQRYLPKIPAAGGCEPGVEVFAQPLLQSGERVHESP